MANVKKILVVITIALSISTQALAQQQPPDQGSSKFGPRKQLATIIFAGLGGAVLGLSTLSFYGRPQDRLANIAIGFALGVIAGTVYVTYNAATKPKDFYSSVDPFTEHDFHETSRQSLLDQQMAKTPTLGLSLTF